MISLITTLMTSLGSAGFGSLLKMLSGCLDSRAAARSDAQKRELLLVLEQRKLDQAFAEALFGGNSETARQGRITRRLVALIGSATFAFLMVWAALYPDVPLTTFTLPAQPAGNSYLWGLVRTAADTPVTVEISTGHLLLVGLSHIGLIFGFYFTPGGRK
ncbi:MAG: hypothetical protein JW739_01550 [Opitutales bacterium]|nr:hypothetical protein [Opitutales bacterium]